MEKDALTHFESGVKALEDIQTLSNQNISPVVKQAFYHFGRGYESLKTSSHTLNGSESLKALVETSFRNIIHKSVLQTENVKQLNIAVEKDLGINTWNHIFNIVDEISILPRTLPFQGSIKLSVGRDQIRLSGEVENTKLEEQKEKCYWLTRNLLKKNILLTFSVKNQKEIELVIDLGHHFSELYVLKADKSRNIWLGFSPILKSHEISPNKFSSMGTHHCVEITDNLNTVCHLRTPVESVLNAKKMIIHFPFLFRPVSLIIPRKGQIMSVGPQRKGNTGSDVTFKINKIPSEFQGEERIPDINYIDIFDLLA